MDFLVGHLVRADANTSYDDTAHAYPDANTSYDDTTNTHAYASNYIRPIWFRFACS